MQKVVVNDLRTLSFPSLNYSEAQEKNLNEDAKFRRCQSFGEVATAISISWSTGQFFKGFYRGLRDEVLTWFVYLVNSEFELPISFRFETACSDGLSAIIFSV